MFLLYTLQKTIHLSLLAVIMKELKEVNSSMKFPSFQFKSDQFFSKGDRDGKII